MEKTKEIFHECRSAGRTFTSEEWGEYCRESHNNDAKRLRTQIGKYLFNDCDICLNPEVMSLVVDGKSYGVYVVIKWADCGNGFWASAIDYSYGNGGGGSGVCYADRPVSEKYSCFAGYRSEKDAKVAACDRALRQLKDKKGDEVVRLIRMVEDYRKSLSRPQIVQLELF